MLLKFRTQQDGKYKNEYLPKKNCNQEHLFLEKFQYLVTASYSIKMSISSHHNLYKVVRNDEKQLTNLQYEKNCPVVEDRRQQVSSPPHSGSGQRVHTVLYTCCSAQTSVSRSALLHTQAQVREYILYCTHVVVQCTNKGQQVSSPLQSTLRLRSESTYFTVLYSVYCCTSRRQDASSSLHSGSGQRVHTLLYTCSSKQAKGSRKGLS